MLSWKRKKHIKYIKRIIHLEAAAPSYSAMVVEFGWRLQLQTAQLVLAHDNEEACDVDGRQHEDFGLLEGAAAAGLADPRDRRGSFLVAARLLATMAVC